MFKIFLSCLSFLLFLNCTNRNTGKIVVLNVDTNQITIDSAFKPEPGTSDNFKLDFIDSSKLIVNCGHHYTYDTTEIINGKYIFIANVFSDGIIQINGKEFYCLKDSSQSVVTLKSFKGVFVGHEYTVTLELSMNGKKYDGGFYHNGTLEVRGKKYHRIFKIHGKSGC